MYYCPILVGQIPDRLPFWMPILGSHVPIPPDSAVLCFSTSAMKKIGWNGKVQLVRPASFGHVRTTENSDISQWFRLIIHFLFGHIWGVSCQSWGDPQETMVVDKY